MEGTPETETYVKPSTTTSFEAPEREQSAVSAAMERLDGAVDHLDRCVAMIEERIGIVLAPQTEKNTGAPEEALSGVALADAITQRSRRVSYMAGHLAEIHSRVEL